jgi:hypothetical protein
MLYEFPKLSRHQASRLNKHIKYFIRRIENITPHSLFNPLTNYFHPEFATFLQKANQTTLRMHFENFFNAYKVLPNADQQLFLRMFKFAQEIEDILGDVAINGNDYKLAQIPLAIRSETMMLFSYLFGRTLKSFGKLKDHYKELCKDIPKICAFCGTEKIHSTFQQDYDHILNEATYIFTSVNMSNLVPSGVICNRVFKTGRDVIYRNNIRQIFYSPYKTHFDIRISLTGSVLPPRLGADATWHIQIIPDNDITRSWNDVFSIKRRYAEDELNGFYLKWINELRDRLFLDGKLPLTAATLVNEFTAHSLVMLNNPFSSTSNIVKGAFFDFLAGYTDASYNTALLNYFNSR